VRLLRKLAQLGKLAQLAAFVGALSLPALAFAQGEEHHAGAEHEKSIDGMRLAWQFLNFGVLVFLLAKFGGPAVSRALQARHQQIKSDLASAAEARAAAEARFQQQEKRLASLEHEIAAISASIKQEAEAEKVRLIAMA
jgi:F-type H+-transporting ATPase subunit b